MRLGKVSVVPNMLVCVSVHTNHTYISVCKPTYTHTYTRMCVCVCVCVSARARVATLVVKCQCLELRAHSYYLTFRRHASSI